MQSVWQTVYRQSDGRTESTGGIQNILIIFAEFNCSMFDRIQDATSSMHLEILSWSKWLG